MKTQSELQEQKREDLVALFGQGRLVRKSRLMVELRGGSRADRIEAVGWISMFMPEVVLSKSKPLSDHGFAFPRQQECVA